MNEPSKATILIVDDEPANVRVLELLLTGAGYERVVATRDSTQVTALFRETDPDLVILDLHMPGLDGYEVMAQLAEMVDADDFRPILVLTADITRESRQRALVEGATDFLTKPFDTSEALARVKNLLRTRLLHLQLRRHNETLEETVKARTHALWQTVNQLESKGKELRVAQEETISSLSLAAEFRDDETSRHIERMSQYCQVIATGMGLDLDRRDTIRLAAKMHDVGKIGIPDSILLKPGRLTSAEFETMKTHAQIGYDILNGASSELSTTAAMIAWTHHEKVDGSGYPRGLSGEEIPLEGRIAAVADVFDALTTDRIYRKAFALPEAFRMMKEGRDSHFDPQILDIFFDHIDDVLSLKASLDQGGQ